MNSIDKVLAVVGSDMQATAGMQRAVRLARDAQAELHLLMCAYDGMLDNVLEVSNRRVQEMAKAHFLDERRAWLNARAVEIAADGVRVQCEVLWAPQSYEATLARVIALQPTLVVKDFAKRHAQDRTAAPSVADLRLARICPVPLMFVQPGAAAVPQRLLAAVDVTLDRDGATHPLNDHIAACALRIATHVDAHLALAYVFPYARPSLSVGISADLRALYDDARHGASDAFSRFAREHSVPDSERHWIEGEGDAVTALEKFIAREHVDLLVVGSSHHSTFERLLLGSVSEDLLRKCGCDVLLVKPPDFAANLPRHHDVAALLRRYGDSVSVRDRSGEHARGASIA